MELFIQALSAIWLVGVGVFAFLLILDILSVFIDADDPDHRSGRMKIAVWAFLVGAAAKVMKFIA